MKVKQHPDDFQVEELTDIVPTDRGAFAIYRLEKGGWTTPDALRVVRRCWKVDLPRLSHGGLKDRHARTVQYFTIFRGPPRGLTHHDLKVDYLGQLTTPYTSKDIRANRFRITLRAVQPDALLRAQEAVEEVRADGLPNYFDDQRFGSVGEKQRFIARSLILGRYEEAVRLALAAPYAFDRAPQKREKAILHTHWRNWKKCQELLPRGAARDLVDYLVSRPDDFRGAVARLAPELGGLYLSAYQSHLWNQILARCLREFCRPEQLFPVRLRLGEVPMHRRLDDAQRIDLAALGIPLPSARARLASSDPRLPLIEAALAEEGFRLHELKIRGVRKPFFSKGERAALCLPAGLEHRVGNDELHEGRRKLLLSFELPRGSYATLLVKRIQSQ
jgi:tRNA pseudouridine13 synthase